MTMENPHVSLEKSTLNGPCSIAMLNYQRVQANMTHHDPHLRWSWDTSEGLCWKAPGARMVIQCTGCGAGPDGAWKDSGHKSPKSKLGRGPTLQDFGVKNQVDIGNPWEPWALKRALRFGSSVHGESLHWFMEKLEIFEALEPPKKGPALFLMSGWQLMVGVYSVAPQS